MSWQKSNQEAYKPTTIVHATRDSTPQNAVNYTSTKPASIITQFLVQNKMKNHKKKVQTRIKNICNKSNGRDSARIYATAPNSCMHAFSNLATDSCSIFHKLQVRNCQSIKFLLFFKIKKFDQSDSRLFLLVNMGACRHCIDVL